MIARNTFYCGWSRKVSVCVCVVFAPVFACMLENSAVLSARIAAVWSELGLN